MACRCDDIRGTGETLAGSEELTLPLLVDDLIGVMDHLGIGQCVLGSDSGGSILSFQAALTSSRPFAGLVVAGGAASIPRAGMEAFVQLLAADFDRTVEDFIVDCFPEPDSDHIKRWTNRIFHRSALDEMQRIAQAFWDEDLTALLPGLKVPTLVIHGSEDRVSSLSNAETMARLIPTSKLVVLPGSGMVRR